MSKKKLDLIKRIFTVHCKDLGSDFVPPIG
jgi:hypothetical protein